MNQNNSTSGLSLSDRLRHFFHVVSNVRPIVWIGLYVALTPVFATIYWLLPAGQFRIPDGGTTEWGSWLYYSIVTITTLGFGDYTPAHGWAQTVTAVEVMCGLILLGFFLNAVGSMKSEIDVASEVEKQRRAHNAMERDKLMKCIPSILHSLNTFLSYCYAVTTPAKDRTPDSEYNPDFRFSDMAQLYLPSGLPNDHSGHPAIERLLGSASRVSLCLDSLQNRIDLTQWPDLLEDCFSFVANYQMFSAEDELLLSRETGPDAACKEKTLSDAIASHDSVPERNSHDKGMAPVVELYYLIKENASIATKIETALTTIASQPED